MSREQQYRIARADHDDEYGLDAYSAAEELIWGEQSARRLAWVAEQEATPGNQTGSKK